MRQATLRTKVLDMLASNISENVFPDIVRCSSLAKQLKISFKELRPVLLSLDESGSIQCDLELNYALITTEGLRQI